MGLKLHDISSEIVSALIHLILTGIEIVIEIEIVNAFIGCAFFLHIEKQKTCIFS